MITRFAEQNPEHPLAEEIKEELGKLTDKAFESTDREEGRNERESKIYAGNLAREMLPFLIEGIGNVKDKRQQKKIAQATEKLYAKVSSELDPEELHKLAKTEKPKETEEQ